MSISLQHARASEEEAALAVERARAELARVRAIDEQMALMRQSTAATRLAIRTAEWRLIGALRVHRIAIEQRLAAETAAIKGATT